MSGLKLGRDRSSIDGRITLAGARWIRPDSLAPRFILNPRPFPFFFRREALDRLSMLVEAEAAHGMEMSSLFTWISIACCQIGGRDGWRFPSSVCRTVRLCGIWRQQQQLQGWKFTDSQSHSGVETCALRCEVSRVWVESSCSTWSHCANDCYGKGKKKSKASLLWGNVLPNVIDKWLPNSNQLPQIPWMHSESREKLCVIVAVLGNTICVLFFLWKRVQFPSKNIFSMFISFSVSFQTTSYNVWVMREQSKCHTCGNDVSYHGCNIFIRDIIVGIYIKNTHF